jgi:hypothetical protein
VATILPAEPRRDVFLTCGPYVRLPLISPQALPSLARDFVLCKGRTINFEDYFFASEYRLHELFTTSVLIVRASSRNIRHMHGIHP